MERAGVLRTEIKPSHDRVSVVGDVDAKVLVKKLARIGKIAEVLPPPPPPQSFDEDGGKQRDDGAKKRQDGGDKPAPALAEEKSGGRDDDKPAAACKQDCNKCASHGAAGDGKANDDNKSGGGGNKKAPPSSKGDAKSAGEGNDGFYGAKPSPAPEHVAVQQFQHYHRAEPAMVVPVHVPPYYPPPAYYGGYYAAPPPPPVMMMGKPRRVPQLRPQPSRFDADYFNDDNTVGCSVM